MAYRKDDDLIFGVHSVLEKLAANPEDIRHILIASSIRTGTFETIAEAARRQGCSVESIGAASLDSMTGHAKHQGVVAKVAPFKYASFPELLERVESCRISCVLVLDHVLDPRNFGSLLRTAEAMGINDVVIPKDRAVGVTATVIKASAGAAHYVRICRVSNLTRSLVSLRDRGAWIMGLDPQGEKSIDEIELPQRLAVVLGAEGVGIRSLIRSKCDYLVSLPMRGRVESLNVGVAWGMFTYEWVRQRRKPRSMC